MVWADGSLSLLPLLSCVSSNFPRVYALLFLGISWPQVTLSKGPSVLPGKGKNEHGRGWLRNRCWIENFWSLLHRLPSGRHPVLPPQYHMPQTFAFGEAGLLCFDVPIFSTFHCNCLCSLNPVTQCCLLDFQISVDTLHLIRFFIRTLFMIYYFLFFFSCLFKVVCIGGVDKLREFNSY